MTYRDQIHPPTALLVMDALKHARALVENGHCQGVAHRMIEGDDEDSGIDCFCAMGALAVACRTVRVGSAIIPGKDIYDAGLKTLKIALSPRWESVADFNDLSSQDAVLNLFSRAIGIVGQVVAA